MGREPTEHSGPYPTGDPNKPQELIDLEAALIFQRWVRGERVEDAAAAFGIGRSTAYERLQSLINGSPLPNKRMMRSVSYARLEAAVLALTKKMETDSDMPVSDLVKLLDLQRKLVDQSAKLLGTNVTSTDGDGTDLSDDEEWDADDHDGAPELGEGTPQANGPTPV